MKRKSKVETIEFDFAGGSRSRSSVKTRDLTIDRGDSESRSNDEEDEPRKANGAGKPMNRSKAMPIMDEVTTNTTRPRRAINGASSARRQASEQKTVGRILGGVGILFLSLVVLVTICAGVGGWVLWKQIENQDMNLTILEDRTAERIDDLEKALALKDAELELMQQRLNARLGTVTTSFEEFRSSTGTDLEKLSSTDAYYKRLISNLNWKATQLDREDKALSSRISAVERVRRR